MYKVVIVDDEDLIRQGLKTFVKWNELGFEVVGEASDGNQAFDIIQELRPHVVLTDIKMPCCTGIDLMKRIKSSGIDVKIVVLSGYDEFEYAKTAINVGAVDYLLKPIKFDKLKEVFLKIKEESDKKIIEAIKVNKAIESLKTQFFSKVISGVIKRPQDILNQAGELNINLNFRFYITILIELDDIADLAGNYTAHDIDLYNFAIRNICEELCSKYGESYIFPLNNAEIVIILGLDSDEINNIKSLVYEIKSSIDSVVDFTVTISVGDVFENIAQLNMSYSECRKRADKKFILGKDRIIFPEDTFNIDFSKCTRDENIEGKLLLLIQSHDTTGIDDLLERHFQSLGSINIICEQFFVIVKSIMKYLEKNNLNITAFIDENKINYDSIRSKETLSDILLELKSIIYKITDNLSNDNLKSKSKIIENVKDIVIKHLDEEISLDTVAQKVHMHPMYLSKIFKKETGINFIDFLTKVRVNRAKQLMNDLSLKTYEISEKVGYKSSKHFSKVFKDITGVTPKEYRKNLLGYEE